MMKMYNTSYTQNSKRVQVQSYLLRAAIFDADVTVREVSFQTSQTSSAGQVVYRPFRQQNSNPLEQWSASSNDQLVCAWDSRPKCRAEPLRNPQAVKPTTS